jgi:DNA-binding MarR family transcriptional regulator
MAVEEASANRVAAERIEEVAKLLGKAQRSLARRLSQVLGDCSFERWQILALLSDSAGHSMSEIADFTSVPAPTLTRVIDGMVSDNLVYRRPDPADGRKVLVYASRRGCELRATLAQRVETSCPEVLPNITSGDMEAVSTALVALVEQLQ